MGSPVGVVVMDYGSPASVDDVEAYYTHIRGGRAPTPEQVVDLVARYEAIGGVSPLHTRTEEQRAGLQARLEELAPGRFVTIVGHRHAPPFIADAAAALAARGIASWVGLVLAPHYSRASVGAYHATLRDAAEASGATVATIDSWHTEPALVSHLAAAVKAARAALPARTQVLFTAHSLPLRALAADDPYESQLRESAALVAAEAALDRWAGWTIAWQSAPPSAEPWKGPDVRDVIRDLAATGRSDAVLVCPHGFTSDHLEVLYDLDVLAAAVAADVGVQYGRTASVNDDPAVLAALARRVAAAAEGLG